MGFENWNPDVLVGIDFGMTSTGVAYSMGPEWHPPKTIQHWPGRVGGELANKVATTVAYDVRTGSLATWGFLVDRENPELQSEELFKLYLDPAHRDAFRHPPDLEDVRRWYKDYLSCIYKNVSQTFSDTIPRWSSKNVEWCFSVPTTWRSPAMIAQTEKLIKDAGFEQKSNHKVRMSLTEAEAAAVYATKQNYERGDVFLVCDAGGGTTDLNVLKLTSSANNGRTNLEPLTWVEGEAIGSTLIDFKVQKLISERLESIRCHLQGEPWAVAEKMMRGRFETFKCSFGSEASNVPHLPLYVPGLQPGMDFPHAQIEASAMIITKEELQRIFDTQIERMFDLIDTQLRRLQEKHARENVSYLILSGGLGSSPYVYKKLKARYEIGGGAAPNAPDLKILRADEPQLAVVHGLVMDRIQEVDRGIVVYNERCCRSSYGLIVRQPYDPMLHQGEDITIDPRDKRRWAEKQIHWFIKQGESIPVAEGIKHPYRLKLNLGTERVPWKTQIVTSSLPAYQLPRSMKYEGARTVCTVESLLSEHDLKLKNRHWYNLGPQYWRAEFNVKILIGAADLRFQLLGKTGTISKTHDDIEVHWAAPSPGANGSAQAYEEYGMYRGAG